MAPVKYVPAICFLLDYSGTTNAVRKHVDAILSGIVALGTGGNWQPGCAVSGNLLEICCSQTCITDGVVTINTELSTADTVQLIAWIQNNYGDVLEELWFDPDWQTYKFVSTKKEDK